MKRNENELTVRRKVAVLSSAMWTERARDGDRKDKKWRVYRSPRFLKRLSFTAEQKTAAFRKRKEHDWIKSFLLNFDLSFHTSVLRLSIMRSIVMNSLLTFQLRFISLWMYRCAVTAEHNVTVTEFLKWWCLCVILRDFIPKVQS